MASTNYIHDVFYSKSSAKIDVPNVKSIRIPLVRELYLNSLSVRL